MLFWYGVYLGMEYRVHKSMNYMWQGTTRFGWNQSGKNAKSTCSTNMPFCLLIAWNPNLCDKTCRILTGTRVHGFTHKALALLSATLQSCILFRSQKKDCSTLWLVNPPWKPVWLFRPLLMLGLKFERKTNARKSNSVSAYKSESAAWKNQILKLWMDCTKALLVDQRM